MGATAPGGPGSTLEGVTEMELSGNVRIDSCVPNMNRGLRRRDIILVHNNHIGSLPNIHCRVIHNALSTRNISNHVRDHSGCNTGHPGGNGWKVSGALLAWVVWILLYNEGFAVCVVMRYLINVQRFITFRCL